MNETNLAAHTEVQSPRPTYPLTSQLQLWELLGALKRGERLTVLTALQNYQVFALSQRMGELRALNWPVKSKTVKTATGKSVSEYSLVE